MAADSVVQLVAPKAALLVVVLDVHLVALLDGVLVVLRAPDWAVVSVALKVVR